MKITITFEDAEDGTVDIKSEFPPGSAESQAANMAVDFLEMVSFLTESKPNLTKVPVEQTKEGP